MAVKVLENLSEKSWKTIDCGWLSSLGGDANSKFSPLGMLSPFPSGAEIHLEVP